MKKTLIFLILINLIPVLCSAETGNESPWEKNLPFKQATISYRLTGIETGKEVLYIRDYGRETVKYHKTTINMIGMVKANETIEFSDPDWIYTFDLVKKNGTKAVNPKKYMIEEYKQLPAQDQNQVVLNSKETGASMTGGMSLDFEKNSTTLLGFSCDRMSFIGSTVYAIHGTNIPLKTESKIMGVTILLEATDFNMDEIDPMIFTHPGDIEPIMDPEADAIAHSVARQTMVILKDPDTAKRTSSINPIYSLPDSQEMTPEEQQQMEEALEALKKIFGD